MLGGLNALSTIKSYKAVIEHENGVVEGEFIYGAMSNSLSVAGMVRLNDDLVDLSDGKFEILLVRRPKDVMEVNSILTGVLNKTYDSPCLTVAQSSFVKFTFEEPVPWTRDGEDGGAHRTLTLRAHRHAVDIYCGKTKYSSSPPLFRRRTSIYAPAPHPSEDRRGGISLFCTVSGFTLLNFLHNNFL